MFRVARARSEKEAEEFKAQISLHYLGAKLQRAKKIPPLKKLTEPAAKPSFKDIVSRIRATGSSPQD